MFRYATTRRLATLQFASVLVGLLTAAACSGNLPLRYGETLCDPTHPCPAGSVCADSICVPDTRPDLDIVPTTDEFEGDWDNPFPETDQDGSINPTTFCRSDEQCGSGEACRDNRCVRTPCFGVACGEGDVCDYTCVPTSAACNGVRCVDNFERCLNGECVPSCEPDACDDPGCNPITDPNCVAGNCTNGTLCFNGVCREITPCGDDGDAFCGPGFLCSLGCSTPSLCDALGCNAGFTCVIETDGMGVQTPTCVGSPCSGLSCGAGETCISGECRDTCEFVPCADGGRQCATEGAICCNGTCCDVGEVCRVIRDDQPGVCLAPTGVCDPPCSNDEVCVAGECLCAEYPNPRECGGGECCRTQTCDNPCDPNPCAGNAAAPLCTVDCAQPQGYTCVSDCEGVTCPLLNTACNPATGQCLCGSPGAVCSGSQCCVDIDASPTTTLACDDPCDPNPCTQAAYGDNRRCVRDCTRAEGFTCTNFCENVNCGPNLTCDPASGQCICGTDGPCGGTGQCCVNDAGTLDCRNPCAGNPCGTSQCTISCGAPGGYVCTNNCNGIDCSNNQQNPDCNPGVTANQCQCLQDGTSNYDLCVGNECCSDTGLCNNPCSPNPCPALGDSGSETQCVGNCRANGPDFDCVDPCSPNRCPTNTNQQNPDCNPAGGAATCTCFANTNGNPCTAGTCCEPGGCQSPCTSGPGGSNPCPNDPGSANNGNPAFTQCSVRCDDPNNYACLNPCAGNNCGTANGGRNPNCRSTTNGQARECFCAISGTVCGAGTCCQGSGCVDPCAGNPCGGSGICAVSCNSPGGYTCTPLCTGSSCQTQANGQNPICDPDDNRSPRVNGCECVGDTVCTGSQCCVDSNNDGTRDGCADPCAGNPCGAGGVCQRDCRVPSGYMCVDSCGGVTCPAQNPDCNPADPNSSTRCTCNITDRCTGNECCVNDICDDACEPDPCTSAPNTRCNRVCSQASGFQCSDPCTGNNCATSQPGRNPQCHPAAGNGDNAECWCASANAQCGAGTCCDKGGVTGCDNPCSPNPCGTSGTCVVDCGQTNGYRCDPVPCSPACVAPLTCNQANGTCQCDGVDVAKPPAANACGAPVQPSGTYPYACCGTAGNEVCIDRICNSNLECSQANGGRNCACDPCLGCSANAGETGSCSNNP